MRASPFRWAACVAMMLALGVVSVRAWTPHATGPLPEGQVPVSLEFSGTARSNSAPWEAVAVEAMGAWNSALNRVRLTQAPTLGQPVHGNRRNELYFGDWLLGGWIQRGVLSMTVVTDYGDQSFESDVAFTFMVPWVRYHGPPQADVVDFYRVVLHELGHVVGFGHTDEASIMQSQTGAIEALTADDRTGVQALYSHGAGAPPRLLAISTGHTVTQGAAVKIGVVAGGRGPFTYAWTHDGKEIPGADGVALELLAATLTDAGDYVVTVSNAAGAVSIDPVQIQVVPAVAPTVTVGAGNGFTSLGSDHLIAATSVTGSAPLRYEWKHNGRSIGETPEADLLLENIQFSDAGGYTLTVSNVAGSVTSRPYTLTVRANRPPRILRDPQSFTVLPGEGCRLDVRVEGIGHMVYQWRKDGVDLPGKTSWWLDLSAVTEEDAGSYSVRATSGLVSVESGVGIVTVAPAEALVFERQPVSVTKFPGAIFSFSVEVNGNDAAFQWYKDGQRLVPGSYNGVHNDSLFLTNVRPEDAGVYTCVATSSRGTVTSHAARLTVLDRRPQEITRHPSPHTVGIGGRVTLTVTVAERFPSAQAAPHQRPYRYQWFKDGQPMAGATAATLSFMADFIDAGTYVARVSWDEGQVESLAAKVSVSATPPSVITTHPPSIFAEAGSEGMSSVRVALETWVRDHVPADGHVWIEETTGSALDGTPEAPGTYSLRATRAGTTEASQTFTIGVLPDVVPVIEVHPRGAIVELGADVELDVFAGGGGLAYQWTKDDVAISGATEATLCLRNFQDDQVGDYRVNVFNEAGQISSEPARLILGAPRLPVISAQPVSMTERVGREIALAVASDGANTYQWFKNGKVVENATSADLVIAAGAVTDAGSYTVVVTNATGAVTSRAAKVQVLAARRAPEFVRVPQNKSVPLGGDVTFVAFADGDPLPASYQWQKDGVDIPGAIDPELRLRAVGPGAGGRYRLVATNAVASTLSPEVTLTVDPRGRLVNISARAPVGTDEDILIAGFIIQGDRPRRVLVRGVGDQLSEFGVAGGLRDPRLRIMNEQGAIIAESNDWNAGDDWMDGGRERVGELKFAMAKSGAFPLRPTTRDSALVTTLAPGAYTAQVSGIGNSTGVALVEVYDLDVPAPTRMINLSCRSYVGRGASILILGVVVHGDEPRRLLIRGAALASDFNIPGALERPVLRVFKNSELVAENRGWSAGFDAGVIAAAAAKVHAFAFVGGSRDAALLLDLAPGEYTIQVSGSQESTGVALAEIYEVSD